MKLSIMIDPAQVLTIFQKQTPPQQLAAGTVIFQEGVTGNCMYGLLEGEVEISLHGRVIETIQAGEVFGVGVLVGVNHRTYTATAKTSCVLASLDHQRFLFAVQETPMFALQVMKSYAERLARLTQIAAQTSSSNA